MTSRRRLLALALAGAVVASAVVVAVVHERRTAGPDAAAQAARRYADLVASGGPEDLPALWAMSASESPGALRTAGEVLAGAEQRIEVLEVGEPTEVTETPDVPYEVDLDRFLRVSVQYRLDGQRGSWPLVLGSAEGQGSEAGDWRVLDGSLGAVDWTAPGFADLWVDRFVGGVWQVRGSGRIGGTDEDVQPLYPAVYPAQGRLDPWFTSEDALVTVTPGDPVAPPELELDPTRRTERDLARQVRRAFASCEEETYLCPAAGLAESLGVNVYVERWWRGMVRQPTVRVEGNVVRLTDGVLRMAGRDGVREVRFEGETSYLLDNQSWRPYLRTYDVDLREVP